MTSHSTAIYTPFADGRKVRDIVEHSPALVTDAWCRQLLRQVLQSLEQQYASGAPHRPITPDSVVMLDSGEALLLPAADAPESATEATLGADLHALALVVHYAISAELPPEGPLGPRLYDDYSDQLTHTIDRCLGPNGRLRPKSIADLRAMLGIEAEAAPVAAETAPVGATMPAPAAVHAAPSLDERDPDITATPQPVVEDALVFHEAGRDGALQHAPAPDDATIALDRAADAPAMAAPDETAEAPPQPQPAPDAYARPALAATPLKPSSHPATPGAATPTMPTRPRQQPPAPRTRGVLERWAMVAGAAVVLLAAGGALYAHLNQDKTTGTADVAALSGPAQEQATRGLDAGEALVTSAASPAQAETAGELATAAQASRLDAAPPGAHPAAAGAARQADAVVNGTTYKLLIKPWGIVYVNGVDRGVSPPVKRLTLGEGQHTIRIVNPNFAEHVMTITAGGAESALIEHDFTAPAEGGK
ncbi:hypothetical protein [Massilia haematophila]|uniref:PEGA domain-containing protein n=1 Tax=Massilia haematophila TaxID=457923 RepID=A0ABV7PHK2_9BURK